MWHLFADFFAPRPHHDAIYFVKLVASVLFVLAILAALQFAPRRSRKGIIALFTFLGGLYYSVEFFWPVKKGTDGNFLTPFQDLVANLSNVVGAFAIGIGVISLLQVHTRAVARQRAGWGNSVALIVSFLLMTVFGLLNQYVPHSRVFGTYVTSHDVFQFLFLGGLNNLDAAMFSIIAFYIASASYRAFRIRSVEASLLMTAALIVMLGSVTFGTALTAWIPVDSFWGNFRIERIAGWLLTKVNAAAQRGILFGLTLGGLAISLRLWLSLERGTYFEKEI